MKAVIGVLFLAPCFAQTPAPAFEAATIKPSKAEAGSSSWHSRTGYLIMKNQTLRALAAIAYHLKEDEVVGGPKWIASDRFDIEARAAGPAQDSELMVMLKALLTERFQFAGHRESKVSSGFALVPIKSGVLKIAPDESEGGERSSSRGTNLEVERISMAKLADSLSRKLSLPVVDATHLPGRYTFKLEWSPDVTPPDPPLGPSLFTVLQQELGLKLESRKLTIGVLMVDKAEKPTDN